MFKDIIPSNQEIVMKFLDEFIEKLGAEEYFSALIRCALIYAYCELLKKENHSSRLTEELLAYCLDKFFEEISIDPDNIPQLFESLNKLAFLCNAFFTKNESDAVASLSTAFQKIVIKKLYLQQHKKEIDETGDAYKAYIQQYPLKPMRPSDEEIKTFEKRLKACNMQAIQDMAVKGFVSHDDGSGRNKLLSFMDNINIIINRDVRAEKIKSLMYSPSKMQNQVNAVLFDESKTLVTEEFLPETKLRLGIVNEMLYLSDTALGTILGNNDKNKSVIDKIEEKIEKDHDALLGVSELDGFFVKGSNFEARLENNKKLITETNPKDSLKCQMNLVNIVNEMKSKINKSSWFDWLFSSEKSKKRNELEKNLNVISFNQTYLLELMRLAEGEQTIEETLDHLQEHIHKHTPGRFKRFFGKQTPDYVIQGKTIFDAIVKKYRESEKASIDARVEGLEAEMKKLQSYSAITKHVLIAVQPYYYFEDNNSGIERVKRVETPSAKALAESLTKLTSPQDAEKIVDDESKNKLLKETKQLLGRA